MLKRHPDEVDISGDAWLELAWVAKKQCEEAEDARRG